MFVSRVTALQLFPPKLILEFCQYIGEIIQQWSGKKKNSVEKSKISNLNIHEDKHLYVREAE